jgi:hypothetical protein
MSALDKTTILQVLGAGAGLSSAACGFYAALLWKSASLVQPTPYWYEKLRNMDWLSAQLEASSKSGNTNKRAAWWTGSAAALAALGAVIGVILVFLK